MSITDELREWGRATLADTSLLVRMEAIADRIDAEHEQQMAERRRSCVFYDAERNYCKVHDEGDMAELGYVRLPVDADGVSIRVGDVLTDDAEFKSEGKVMRLMLEDEGWMVGFGCGGWTETSIHKWHHYHAPTVEDVLREFAYGLGVPVADSYVAATAAKLRLAEGEDA